MKKKITVISMLAILLSAGNIYAGVLSSKFHIYFNRPVNTTVSTGTNAQYIGAATVDTIVAYINRAKYTIDIAQYDYTQGVTMGKIGTAVNSAYSRGVVVRWVFDGSQANTGLSGLNAGIKTNGRPANSNSYIMHDKFMIIDAAAADTTLSIVYTASMDWGLEQDDSDFNNTVFIQSQQLAKAYTAQFNQMWGSTTATPDSLNAKFGSAKTSLGPHIFTIDGIEVELYFSPTDSTNNHILDAIATANSQLYFGMYTFSESLDAPPINAKYTGGVDVDGIIDQFTLQTPTSQWSTLLGTLGASRLKEYVQPNSIYHNKYLIVDACNVNSDPLVLTGSHNWTVGANEGNDENTIIMHDPTITNIYYQAFNANFAYLGGTITGCTVNVSCNNVITTTTAVNNNVLCYGASTGSATVHAHGAGVPFTYAWTGGQTDSTLSNVAAGTYTVTVTDHNQCSVTASVTITQPSAALSVTNTPTSPSCFGGNNGQLSAAGTGGTSPYTYVWGTSPQQTTAVATNLAAGTYRVTVTDHNQCTATASATITQPSGAVSVTNTPTSPSCFGGSNGQVTATGTGGTNPYSYVWSTSPQQTTATASNLGAGSYTVTVSDANHCTATASATLSAPAQISITGTTTGVTCQGNNGTITAHATGGSGTYTYSWSTSPVQTTAEATGLAAGSFTVTITDSHSCTASASFTVIQSGTGFTLSTTNTPTGCGQNTGSVSVTVVSGTGSYTYAWNTGATTAQVNALGAGNYTVTVSGTGGCTATASAVVNSSGGPTVSATSTATTCGGNNGTAHVTATGGSSPYTYAWTGGSTGQSISNLASGTYTVTVTDANHCVAVGNTTVSGSSVPSTSATSVNASCGSSDGSATASATGGTSPYTYAWSNGGSTATISNLAANTYHVTVTDHAGCTATAAVQVSANGIGTVSLTASDSSICNNDTVQICATTGFSTYQWSNGASSACITVMQAGTYTVTAMNGGSCSVVSTPLTVNQGNAPQVTVTVTNEVSSYVLNCSPADYYQWYFNGQTIANATSNVYVARNDGVYTVNATSSNGCSTLSQPVTIVFTGIPAVVADAVKIYPNPSGIDYWQLETTPEWIGAVYELVDAKGDVITMAEIQGAITNIKCPVAQGVYFLKITTGQQRIVKKVIKL